MHRTPGQSLVFAVVTASVLLVAVPSAAQTTWSGAVSSVWSAAGNWVGGVPTAGINAVIPAGTPNAPSTAGVSVAACKDLTLNPGATLTIAAGTAFQASGTATVDGTISGGAPIRLVGPQPVSLLGTGSYASGIDIAKSPGINVSIGASFSTSSLTLTTGMLTASNGGSHTTSVSGSAQFQGGVLSANQPGILDVAGDVTFSGTTTNPVVPTIKCGGNWSSDAAFAPASGLVELDGTGAQSVSAAGSFRALTVAAGSTATASGLTINGTLTVTGSLAVSGTLAANGDVSVGAGAVLDVGGGTDTIGGTLTANGSVLSTGTLVFDGGNNTSIFGSGVLPAIQIAKTGGASLAVAASFTASGLTHASGLLQVSNSGAQTLSVTGNAQFQGGTLGVNAIGTIDVAGNVTFSGTSVTGSAPTIRCGGNWTSDAGFAPAAGTVEMDGIGAQTISASGAFRTLTVKVGSSSSATNLTVNNTLTVDGSLAVSGTLDANADVAVTLGGVLDVGGGTDTIGGALAVNGSLTATGTVVFDGGNNGNISGSGSLPAIQVAKTGGASIAVAGSFSATSLAQTSGVLLVSNGGAQTMTVSGNAQFLGGTLIVNAIGTIDVGGDVTFAGTAVTGSAPTIRCAGNWTADTAFAPTSGLVELDGAGPTTVAHAVAGGTLTFATLVVKNGARTLANDFTIAASTITIDPTGSLAVSGGRRLRVHRPGTTVFAVNGALTVAANGELSMGPQSTATVAPSGSLSLVGTAAQPAKITGESGGGYGLVVNGALAAKDFVVKEMGAGGLVIGFPATLAAAPNDFRNGTLDFRTGAPGGSVLLDVRRNAPAILDQLVFLNTPGAGGVFNVKTDSASVPVSFTNWTGAFSGPSFENDPGGLITWNTQVPPVLADFHVNPGAELAKVYWTMTTQTGVSAWQIRAATSAAGPFPVVAGLGLAGPGYLFVHQPLTANQQRFYLLYASMSGGESLLIASGSATPYSSAPPPNVYKVGGGGPFATIQAAVNAATASNSVVWVTPGTYAPFSIGASAPANLHVLGFGGTVTVDTSSGPVQISNVPASSGIELSNLTVGSPATGQNGIAISGCAAPIVLDEITVACDATHTAVQVAACPSTAIQRCLIQGGTGLGVTAGSYVAVSRGSLSSLVATGSTIEMAGLTPGSVSVTPAASLIARSGLMPDVDLPELLSLTQPAALFIDAFPNAPYIVIAAPSLGFTTVSPFEMPVLVDVPGMVQLQPMLTDALGQGVIGFEIPPNAALLGFTYVVQIGALDPSTNNWRFSNVETMVAMP